MIPVYVIHQQGRNLVLRFTDPETGRQVTRTSGTTDMALARKLAEKLREKLENGEFARGSAMTWETFCKKFEGDYLTGLKAGTQQGYRTVLEGFTKFANPKRPSSVTVDLVQSYLSSVRKRVGSENTVANHATHLRAILNWAYELEAIPQRIPVKRVQRAKKSTGSPMKGRPMTEEEFERFLKAMPVVIGKVQRGISKDLADWEFFLRGMWLSGLRLEESTEFYWDREDKLHLYDGMLRIHDDMEKGNRDRLLPLTPDFVEFLDQVPEYQRTGRVFKIVPEHKTAKHTISKLCCEIGEEAKIVVNAKSGKFASLHDFRRTFGDRWSSRVEAAILMQLMRHSSITTTLRYYVGRDAKRLMERLGSEFGSTGKNNLPRNDS